MFVRVGLVTPGYHLFNAGYYGDYWSSVGRDNSGAYYLYFTSGYVDLSNTNGRPNGQSVRCVALGG